MSTRPHTSNQQSLQLITGAYNQTKFPPQAEVEEETKLQAIEAPEIPLAGAEEEGAEPTIYSNRSRLRTHLPLPFNSNWKTQYRLQREIAFRTVTVKALAVTPQELILQP